MTVTTTKTRKKTPAAKAPAKPAAKAASIVQAASDEQGQSIPFNQLFRSSVNVRKTHPAQAVEELAESLKAHGLIQSLVTVKEGDRYGVIAGGRRFLAMSLLVERGDWSETTPILCRVVSAKEAEEVSLAENMMRLAMHPADQFEAFAARVDAGEKIDEIALRFGVTPSIVHQRLKLAQVSPAVIEAFRGGKVNLEHVMAFTVSEDHEAQDSVLAWACALPYQFRASDIRSRLTSGAVRSDNTLVSFVGLGAYVEAGGEVATDLFGNHDFLTNPDLLRELADKKLDKIRADLEAEGWSWVESVPTRPTWFHSAARLYPVESDTLTDEQKARLAQVQERLQELEAAAEGHDDGLTEEEDAEFDRLTGEAEAIQETAKAFAPEAFAQAGAMLVTEGYEIGSISRGIVRPGKGKPAARPDAAVERPKEASGGIPAGLRETLLQERTAALQASLSADPLMIVRVMVYSFMASYGPMNVQVSAAMVPSRGASPALETVQAFHSSVLNPLRIPAKREDLWPWLMEQDADSLLALVAAHGLRAISAGTGDWSEKQSIETTIAKSIGFDMRDWWKPTADNFFRSLPKAAIAECMTDAGGDPGEWQKAKRDTLAEAAEEQAAEAKWLPPFLQK